MYTQCAARFLLEGQWHVKPKDRPCKVFAHFFFLMQMFVFIHVSVQVSMWMCCVVVCCQLQDSVMFVFVLVCILRVIRSVS